MNESHHHGSDHDAVDDRVRDVDDEDRDEVIAFLADQGKVEDEADGEGDEGEQSNEEANSRRRPVQGMMRFSLVLLPVDDG